TSVEGGASGRASGGAAGPTSVEGGAGGGGEGGRVSSALPARFLRSRRRVPTVRVEASRTTTTNTRIASRMITVR
ncbi:MAG: hypothetical protein M1115_10065, partial [Actinobacteria bacterium]|nr:hypothetical protein [Actinomycetota bacterium]